MKKLPLILGIVILISVIYLAFMSKGQIINITYLPGKNPLTANSLIALLLFSAMSAIGSFLISYYSISELKDQLKRQLRSTEKASIITQEASDKVKNLQAKIDTLEIALKEALNRK